MKTAVFSAIAGLAILTTCKSTLPKIKVYGGLKEVARFEAEDFVLPAAVVPSYPLATKSITPEQDMPVYEYGDKTLVIAGGAVLLISKEGNVVRLPKRFPGNYRLSYLEEDLLTVVSLSFGSTIFTRYNLKTGDVSARKFSIRCDGGARCGKMTIVWGNTAAYVIKDDELFDPPPQIMLFDSAVSYGAGAGDKFFLTLKSGNVMDVWAYGLDPLRNLWKSVGALLGITNEGVLMLKDWESEVWIQNPATGEHTRTIRLVGFDGRFVCFRAPYLFYSCTATESSPAKFQIDTHGGKTIPKGTNKVAGFTMQDVTSGTSWFVEYYGDSILPGRTVIGAKSEDGKLKLIQVPSFTVLAEVEPGAVSAHSRGKNLVVLFERGNRDCSIVLYEVSGGN